MKLTFLSKCIHNATVPAILLVLASASLSYGETRGMTPTHIRYPTNRKGIQTNMRYMVPQKEQDDGRYQPPRSPGYNEYLGG
jgi:hypothetical protein